MPETPNTQPEEARQAEAPKVPKPEAPAEAQAPIVRAIRWLQSKYNGLCQGIVNAGNGTNEFAKKALRKEAGPAEEVNVLKTPFHATGHALDGGVLTAPRRGHEVSESIVDGLRAIHRGTIGTIMNPGRLLTREFWKTPIRTITSGVKTAVNALRIPDRSVDDIVNIGIQKPTNQLNFKISKIPVIGPIISVTTNFIAKVSAKITGGIRKAFDWITSPIDRIHDAVAPA